MTRLRQFSKVQKFFVFVVIFVCGLLFYANGVAFNLFSVPAFAYDTIANAVLAVALTLTVITLTVVLRDMRNGTFPRTQKSQIIRDVKEPERSHGTTPLPINAQKTISSVKLGAEEFQAAILEQNSQPLKQEKTERTKLICPACRKIFDLPTYLGELMVDFGPPKPSNLIRQCHHCGAIIELKQKGAEDEEVWRE